jgi:hypothetical protein
MAQGIYRVANLAIVAVLSKTFSVMWGLSRYGQLGHVGGSQRLMAEFRDSTYLLMK